jgi:hypothetical protein
MSLNDNLISYYKLDEASGNANDVHGDADLTETGTVDQQSGKINNARGAYVSTEKLATSSADMSFNIGTSFSVNFWIFRTGTQGAEARFVDINGGSVGDFFFNIRLETDNTLRIILGEVSASSTIIDTADVLPLNEWVMVTFTYDGVTGDMEYYLNADSKGTGNDPAETPVSTTKFSLGNEFTGGTPLTDGYLDECGLWDVELSSTEVTELYDSGDALPYPFPEPTPTSTDNPNKGTKSTKEIAKINIPEGIGDTMNLLFDSSNVLTKNRVGLELDGGVF